MIIVDNSSIKIEYILNTANCMLYCGGRGQISYKEKEAWCLNL